MRLRRRSTKYKEEDVKNILQEVEQDIEDLNYIKINLKERMENDFFSRPS